MEKLVLTNEQENFVKISKIILDVLPTKLRQYFKDKWDETYHNNNWDDTSKSSQFLVSLIPSNVKKNPHNKRNVDYLKTNGDTSDWDPTLLFFVLLYSGLQLITPCRKKAQRNIPLFDSEVIDILREIRNGCFAHLKDMSLPSVEFQTVVGDLNTVCTLFGPDCKREVDEIVQSKVHTQLSEQLMEQLKTQEKSNEEFNKWLHERIDAFEKELTGICLFKLCFML